jgi:hypothetical protein
VAATEDFIEDRCGSRWGPTLRRRSRGNRTLRQLAGIGCQLTDLISQSFNVSHWVKQHRASSLISVKRGDNLLRRQHCTTLSHGLQDDNTKGFELAGDY